ncbi:hypothetical protein ACXHJ2_02550 [Paenibacillus sp. ALE3]|nr:MULTISPECIES: hypothetical protein [unclassified Paenibacillus]
MEPIRQHPDGSGNRGLLNVLVHLPQTGVAIVKRGQRWCLAELF